jgi:hypothetical protein
MMAETAFFGVHESSFASAEHKGKILPGGVVNPYPYIEHNRNKIDYAEYKRRGHYIRPGPIESGNKSVVQKRCKQAGMRWNMANA